MALELKCPAYADGQLIPATYTGEASDIPPPLEWSNVPEGTREFALICEDPDAPAPFERPFVHWVIYNISPNVTFIPEGVLPKESIEWPVMSYQGKNSYGKIGYGGPMPPAGHGVHHYVFRLYALSTETNLPGGARKTELLEAMKGKILETAQLTGLYERQEARRAG